MIVFISALANSANILLDKLVLSRQKMTLQNYIPLLFAFLFLATLITVPWLGGVDTVLAWNQQYIFYFVLMVLLAIMWNIFYYQGLQKEKLVEFEMIILLTPLATVILSALFFPEEFNGPVFLAALLGGLTLFLSHVERHHFQFDRYAIHLLLAVILMAMEAMVQKELLLVYSPVMLYLIRTAVLAIFFTIYYRPKLHEIKDVQFKLVAASGALGALYFVTRLYGFQEYGVVFTTLVLLLGPVVVSLFDTKINGTPVKRRTILAFIVILGCVAYAATQQML